MMILYNRIDIDGGDENGDDDDNGYMMMMIRLAFRYVQYINVSSSGSSVTRQIYTK